MVESHFFVFQKKIQQLIAQNELLQSTPNSKANPEALKLSLSLSVQLINDLFIQFNKDQDRIKKLNEKNNKLETKYNEDIVNSRLLWDKLGTIFQEANQICEIASANSKGLRTLKE